MINFNDDVHFCIMFQQNSQSTLIMKIYQSKRNTSCLSCGLITMPTYSSCNLVIVLFIASWLIIRINLTERPSDDQRFRYLEIHFYCKANQIEVWTTRLKDFHFDEFQLM